MRWPTRAFMSSTRRRSGGRRLGLLCVLLCLTASAEFGSDLPIGYQEITDVGDGNYRVVARCVETRALLEAIAAKTGKPIVFDQPCNTYVSILLPDKVAPPEKWLDYVAAKGGYLHCELKADGAWHVFALSRNPEYQPALTEQEVLKEFRVDLHAESDVLSGIREGLVFCRGALIAPPYEVTWQLTGEGRADVAINGVTVEQVFIPVISTSTSTSTLDEVPELPASGQFEEYDDLDRYLAFRLYPSLLAAMSPQQAREAVKAFIETQQIVEEIVDEQQQDEQQRVGGFVVRLVDFTPLVFLFPANYDYDTGKTRQPKYPGDTLDEVAARSAAAIESSLSDDRILIYGDGMSMLRRGDAARFADGLKLARDLPLAQAECLIREVVSSPRQSRRLVANLSGSYDRAVDLLEALRLRNSQPAPATEGDDIKRAVDSLVR
jgi:hypothetical protein